ncbi:MAG: hypothetical protein RL179_111 [Planctomycetota bacterium]
MSLRLFVIYCALIGGICSYLGWAVGLSITSEGVLRAALKGLFAGALIGTGLSQLDSIWNGRSLFFAICHTLIAAILAGAGGFLGGIIGELLFKIHNSLIIAGWLVTGLLIGMAISAFELFMSLGNPMAKSAAVSKAIKCMVGGALGGMLGGGIFYSVSLVWASKFGPGIFWTPPAIGFSVLGICIGMFIGLAQVLIKEAWVRIENGRWQGKELILAKPVSVIGRREGCEIALFGDRNLAPEHACIRKRENGFFLADLDSPDGTYLNKKRIKEETPLATDDIIQTGATRLKFLEKTRTRA